jgi:hypothetical protein
MPSFTSFDVHVLDYIAYVKKPFPNFPQILYILLFKLSKRPAEVKVAGIVTSVSMP